MKPLVVIPTFNERENLRQLIPAVLETDARLHILVVDDASPDRTADLVMEISEAQSPLRLFLKTRPGKLGLGSAYIEGFEWGLKAGYDFFIEMDADWSHQPKYLKTMLALAVEADFVIGSRYVPGGGTVNWGWARRLLSRFGSLYSRLILGVPIADFTGGFNGWRADVLEAVSLNTLRSDGYSFQVELKFRAAKLGFGFAEFPIMFAERRAGQSKMSPAIVREAIWRVWAMRIKYSGPQPLLPYDYRSEEPPRRTLSQ